MQGGEGFPVRRAVDVRTDRHSDEGPPADAKTAEVHVDVVDQADSLIVAETQA
jgi:hypothetical protein